MRIIALATIIICSILNGNAQTRQIIPFNNNWLFTKDTVKANWEPVTIPHTYNKEDMQLGKKFYTGNAYYKKDFFVTDSMKGKRIFLKFDAVGQIATIYINGKFLTEHKGGYSTFAFEVTNVVKYDSINQILVKTNNEARKDIIPVNHELFPIYGGIYRPVSMITTSPLNIAVTDYGSSGVQVMQDVKLKSKALITVKAKLENKQKFQDEVDLRLIVKNAEGKVIADGRKKITVQPQGTTYAIDSIQLQNPHLWNGIYDPYLHTLDIVLEKNGKIIDNITQPLGIRKIELIADKGVFLNGKKYPMFGVTRHQDRWQFGNALSADQEREDMNFIKEMGSTTIRLAHYQQSEHMYALADSIGFLIWAEIPFVNASTKLEADNAKQQMIELVRQNLNHPSIYIWGLHNEVYSKTKDDYVPVLTTVLNDIAKTEDPYRPTVSVNGHGEMQRQENLRADVQGMNRYYGWYEGKIGDLEPWAAGLEKNYPGYKIMLSEYGADGNIDQISECLPETEKINSTTGKFSPECYQTETHIQQWAIIQKHPNLLASYLWNMFEFATPLWDRGGVTARNLKGLITFDRKRKKDAFYWYKANWNPDPMVYLANRRDSIRTIAKTTIQVFSNLPQVNLYLNGREVKGRKGVNDCHWLYDVSLKKGKNKIKATGIAKGKMQTDNMVWLLN